MTKRSIMRMTVDVGMTGVLLFLMPYSLVGEAAHEWLGMAMLLLLLVHHGLNLGWYRRLRKGRYTVFRRFQLVLTVLLLASMLGAMLSGIAMSRYAVPFLSPQSGLEAARLVHLFCTYWGFVLMSVHLGLHWGMILAMVRKAAKGHLSRLITVMLRLIGVAVAGCGLIAFLKNRIADYLLLRTHFVWLDFDAALSSVLLEYLFIMGFFVWLGYYAGRLLQKASRAEQNL